MTYKTDVLVNEGQLTDFCIDTIAQWSSDPIQLFTSVISQAIAADGIGWCVVSETEQLGRACFVVYITTNKSLIVQALVNAIESNKQLWDQIWYQTTRGGQYVFHVPCTRVTTQESND